MVVNELTKTIADYLKKVQADAEKLSLNDLIIEHSKLLEESKKPDFWQDNIKAQAAMKRLSQLEARTKPWQELIANFKELNELVQLKDNSLESDIQNQLDKAKQTYEELKADLRFSGTYDDHSAILSIYAGAGGTDAQDWVQILLRMYMRWAEKKDFKITTLAESAGEEAGLKSITLEVDGDFAYGLLKSEHGVHRLVRLSPFNADNLRQTSFAKVDILPKIEQSSELDLDEKELKIDVFRAGGHGGQSVNTTDSAVRVTHLPTNITVSIQNERSQLQNKETALTILRSKLAALKMEQHKEKLSDLKGPNQSAEWGNQIRSYVLHPYKQVKDLRTKHETSEADKVLDGNLDPFIEAYLASSSTLI